jgi:hypothetical protein
MSAPSVDRGNIYVVFVDFLKAFDLVERVILMQKLIDMRVIPTDLLIAVALLLDINFVVVNDNLLFIRPHPTE